MSLRTRFARPAAALAATFSVALAALSPLLTPAPARAQAAPGVKVSVLHAANYPSTLTVGPDGSLFGTEGKDFGTIFKVTLGGLFHTLIHFTPAGGIVPSDGPLLLLPNGSFFGCTVYGGKSNTGSLFQFTPTRRFQVKHEFASVSGYQSNYENVRGAYPELPMVRGSDGAIYGATSRGGSTGGGVIFRYTAAHGVEVVHTFTRFDNCLGGLTLGPDGALYGTSIGGSYGAGEIFRCTTTGEFSVLHAFIGFMSADGAGPNGVPVVGPDGALYGTTQYGGAHDRGLAYRITTGGDYTVVYTFQTGNSVTLPTSPFVLGPDGKLYGEAGFGPRYVGAIYRMTADGNVTVLYRNMLYADGPGGKLIAPVFGRDNRLYVSSYNAIYKITVPF